MRFGPCSVLVLICGLSACANGSGDKAGVNLSDYAPSDYWNAPPPVPTAGLRGQPSVAAPAAKGGSATGISADAQQAIALFRQTCLSHSPDRAALRKAAAAAGLQPDERLTGMPGLRADSLMAGSISTGVMLQVNVATTAAYECAVVAIDKGKSRTDAVRSALQSAVGGTRVRIGSQSYTTSVHSQTSLGIVEHALVLTQN